MEKEAVGPVAGALGKAWGIGKVLLGFGDKMPKWLWPLFGIAAASPVVGYALESRREKSKRTDEIRRRMNVMRQLPGGEALPMNFGETQPLQAKRTSEEGYLPFPLPPKQESILSKFGEARVVVARSLGRPEIKESGLNELGIMLQQAKNRAKQKSPASTLNEGVDTEPKGEKPEEKREQQGEARPAADYASVGGGMAHGV